MKCKNCKREIDSDSIFCKWCGQRQIKEAKKEVRVPEPRLLPSGKWFIQLRIDGVSHSITEETEAKCRARAVAIKSGLIVEKATSNSTLRAACDRYINDRSNTLSPSTIRGYRKIQKLRFQSVMDKSIKNVTNWQKVVNDEAKLCSPKTLKNAWGFIFCVLKNEGMTVEVITPKVPKAERLWLTPEQIKVFVKAVAGKPCEIPALLALHSLRRSEIAGLTWDNIHLEKGTITVSGSAVLDEHNEVVSKATNKTDSSTRIVRIVIPELLDKLLAEEDKTGSVYKGYINSPYYAINKVCEANGLPKVGIHGLRHSFASLGYHLRMSEMEVMRIGGWSDFETVRKIYTHLSQLDETKAANKMEQFYRENSISKSVSK
jgi:integrase